MSSSPLSAGAACLSFYYTIPASLATLHVNTTTEDNVPIELWSVTSRSVRTWTFERLFLDNGSSAVEFAVKSAKNAIVAVDNITIEKFTCPPGYQVVSNEIPAYCRSNGSAKPTCEPIDCGRPTSPHHGHVSQTATAYGSTATISCETGYNLTGSGISTCGGDGRWNSTGQICTPVDCGRPNSPQHGHVSQTATIYGSTASISCETGYNLTGSGIATCGSDGRWNSTSQTCTPVDCGRPTSPQHGHVSQTATTYGSTATISCETGYNLTGSGTSTCGSDGRWNNTSQTCTPVDCGRPTSPQHGHVSHIVTTYGSTTTISCETGYNLRGSGISTCGSDGRWNSTGQTCTPVDCGRLTLPQHGHVSQTATTYGSTATISCETGYNLTGSGTSTCGSDGRWNNTSQTCTPVDCGRPTSPNHGHVSQTATTYGSTATISCETGYNLTGSGISTCGSDGRWNSTGQICTPVDCGRPNSPQHGHVSQTATTYGSTASISCETGYNLTGRGIATCGSDGRWNSTGQTCSPVDCGRPTAPQHGHVSQTATTLESTATISCETGYNLTGSGISTCGSNGRWNNTSQTCIPVDCGRPTAPQHGHVSQTATTYGSTATISCETGYNLTGSGTSTCGSDRRWNSTGQTCTPVDCGRLTMPQHGHVSQTATIYGSTATISCETGYNLTGSGISTCGSDGRWNNTSQTCTPVDCGRPTSPQHGHVSQTATSYGSTATLSCETGYNLTGSGTSTCGSDGRWNSTDQTCTPVDCGRPTATQHGHVSQTATTLGSTATISCETGYNLSGSGISTCGSNGRWNNTSQTCIPVDCGRPTAPQHGHVSQTATTYGSTATISCETGYNLTGSGTSTCGSDRRWNSTGQTCTPVDCGRLTMPQHGHVSQTATTYGSTAAISCETGYNLTGSRTSTCGSDRRWNSTGQTCTPVDCGRPTSPQHGHVSQTATSYGSTATMSCETGYNLTGSGTSTCGSDGRWNSTGQTCTPVDCGRPTATQHGHVSQTATTLGSIATISCEAGYNLTGSGISTCGSDGRWNNTSQTCTPVDCGRPTAPQHGHVSQTATTYGSTATISCETGYNLTGSGTSTCGSDGRWKNTSHTCTPVDCGRLTVPQHGHVSQNATSYGSTATISCETGYNLTGSGTSTCGSDGRWNNTSQTCTPVDCGRPTTTQHGHVSPSTTTYGSTATISCDTGYNLTGSGIATCGSDGRWNSTGQTCTPVDCGRLTAPQHGHVSQIATIYGSTATISCETGYNLTGSGISTCGSDGRWNSTSHTCTPVDCGRLPAPQHVHVSHSATSYGSTATISCEAGYNLTGSGISTCGSDGRWNNTNQTCTPVDCGRPTSPQHGHVSQTANTYGSTATISCETGYNLTGSGISTCGSDGRWNSTGQICTPVATTPISTRSTVTSTTTDLSSTPSVTNLPTSISSKASSSTSTVRIPRSTVPTDKIPDDISKTFSKTTPLTTGAVSIPSPKPSKPSTSITEYLSNPMTSSPLPISNIYTSRPDNEHTTSLPLPTTHSTTAQETIISLTPKRSSTQSSSRTSIMEITTASSMTNGTSTSVSTTQISSTNITTVKHVITTLKSTLISKLILSTTGVVSTAGVPLTVKINSTLAPTTVYCGRPTAPQHGHVSQTATIYGSTATVSCETGYNLTGSGISTCGSDGRWTNTSQTCTPVDCGRLMAPQHGQVSQTATSYGSTATVSCEAGYNITGSGLSTCRSDGRWNNTSQTCTPVDCGRLPVPQHGHVSPTATSYGSTATISCDNGFKLIGSGISTCGSDGRWNSTGQTCTPVDCGPLSDIANAQTYLEKQTFGSLANVSCDKGYIMVGDNTSVCLSNGSWSKTYGICTPVDCGPISKGRQQEITYTGNRTTFGAQAIMVCDVGYYIFNTTGDKSEAIKCLAKGQTGYWEKKQFADCVAIFCEGFNVSEGVTITSGYKLPNVQNTTVSFACSEKYILSGFKSITCLSNGEWSGRPPICVKVEKQVQNCSANTDLADRHWPQTSPGIIQVIDCHEKGAVGVIRRKCSIGGEWLPPVDGCVRKEIEKISAQVDAIKASPTEESLSESLDQLSAITNVSLTSELGNQRSSSTSSGELQKVTDILSTIVTASENITKVTNDQVQKFLDTTSNLLDMRNTLSWKSIEDNNDNKGNEKEKTGAAEVLQVVGRYIEVISKSMNASNDVSKTVKAANIVLHVSRLDTNTSDIRFPKEHEHEDIKSSILLPKSSLSQSSTFSTVVYKNLSGILSSNNVGNESNTQSFISSEVVAVTMDNWETNLDFSITLTLGYVQNKPGRPNCNFWNTSSFAWDTFGCSLSNSTTFSSTCTCNHLTNFAILISPWVEKNVNTFVLNLISIIGCSVSMLGLIITVVLHTALWRYMRSDRIILLLNLSCALIMSYAIFLGGVDRTENKIVCTTIAALLQYVYLVVFFLMLAEGIEIAVTVLYVFVTKSRLKWMLPCAWGCPAVIVGVSMGVTQMEGYGNKEFCWISLQGGLIWSFVGPAAIIIIVNLILLVLVIRTMFQAKTISERSTKGKTEAGVRCLCVLLPLMGSTWVIGLLYVNERMAWVQYVFAVCNSLQGLMIFICHCLLNPQLRAALKRRAKKQSSSYFSTNSTSAVPRNSKPQSIDLTDAERRKDVEGMEQNDGIGMSTTNLG
ncbi:sushi, von Willebrand factor type A, EGF and pentraxin domain-containing protein 1-like isoform X5 [Dreissena polymorpha]|uniref:sushi, von Willebrand factor type A, EGF and pentraxin domain-containing protein 1-like isoform X5 n=1 Tax=Dreissena polymorpha TaxID=45954 RepID=UPI002264E114|nr:sushi, von Willebrand factor type A, EGF and pentraxin domain-containing protein 1-like isoform X5 [Dreissena polymorpha]